MRHQESGGCRIKDLSRIGDDENDDKIVHMCREFLETVSSDPKIALLDEINSLINDTLPDSIASDIQAVTFLEFVVHAISNCDSYPHLFVQIATFCKKWSVTEGVQRLFNDEFLFEICGVISNIELDTSTICGCASLAQAIANILILFSPPQEVVTKIVEESLNWFGRFDTLSPMTEANVAIVSALSYYHYEIIEPVAQAFVDPIIHVLLAAIEANKVIFQDYSDLVLSALGELSYLCKIPEVQYKLVHPAFLQDILPSLLACDRPEYCSVLLIIKLLGTSEHEEIRDKLFHLFNWEKFSEQFCKCRFSGHRDRLFMGDEEGSDRLKEGFCAVIREILTPERNTEEEEEEEDRDDTQTSQRIYTLYENYVIQNMCALTWNHSGAGQNQSSAVRCAAIKTIMAIFPYCESMVKTLIVKMLDKELHEFIDYMETDSDVHEMLPEFYYQVIHHVSNLSEVQRTGHMNYLLTGLESVSLDDLSDDTREAGERIFQLFEDPAEQMDE